MAWIKDGGMGGPGGGAAAQRTTLFKSLKSQSPLSEGSVGALVSRLGREELEEEKTGRGFES